MSTSRERPILMSAPMVRALLAGTKTQTRRAIKPQPSEHHWQTLPSYELRQTQMVTIDGRAAVRFSHSIPQNREWHHDRWVCCPYGKPGGRLWVRETHSLRPADGDPETIVAAYRATDHECNGPWKPAIHMPRWASRITLEVTGVRVERLQDISEADAKAEGAEPLLVPPDGGSSPHVEGYRQLWESINGPGSCGANPWVWVVEFRRVSR